MRRPVEILFGDSGFVNFTTKETDPANMSEQELRSFNESLQKPHKLLKEEVAEVLEDCLTLKQRCVLQLRFGLVDGKARTLVEAAAEIGRARSTVWKHEKAALAKMRAPGNRQRLKDYLE